MENSKQTILQEVKETIRGNRSWVKVFGRVGYAARGFVYILIGILALSGTFGTQRVETTGSRSALEQIVELPFGQILLIIVAVGLVCHAVWRFIQGFMDTDDKGSDAKGYLIRTGFSLVGLIYLGLAFSAVKILLGVSKQSEFWAKSWTALILDQPFGQWIVAIIGTIIAGIGFYQFFKAFSTNFREHLHSELESDVKNIGVHIGRYGLIARGIVFCLIGGFFIFAAWSSNAGRTRDFGNALHFVEQQPYGVWLLGILAIGLIAYGIFMLFLARYREMVSG